jgi:hypothetical protein
MTTRDRLVALRNAIEKNNRQDYNQKSSGHCALKECLELNLNLSYYLRLQPYSWNYIFGWKECMPGGKDMILNAAIKLRLPSDRTETALDAVYRIDKLLEKYY